MKIRNIPKELVKRYEITPSADNVYDLPAIWFKNNVIYLIDQRVLPNKFEIYEVKNYEDVIFAINDMVIRGAPAIGAMAAYGMAQAADQKQDHDLEMVRDKFLATRPTAFDLFFAVEHMMTRLAAGEKPALAAENYVQEIIARCRTIGKFGNELIKDGDKVLTHCNAGALATVDHGTALAPMRLANEYGKNIFVYVDETRPRLQGAKLTAWELYNEGISHTLIVDNAAGYYLHCGEIDLVITGADRITRNGDAANKIGTYEKAVLAHENGIPFYIAAPISTIDMSKTSGSEIPIEERGSEEVLMVNGLPITNDGICARNPAFDVTPHKYITGFITEFGVLKPAEIEDVVKNKAPSGLKSGSL